MEQLESMNFIQLTIKQEIGIFDHFLSLKPMYHANKEKKCPPKLNLQFSKTHLYLFVTKKNHNLLTDCLVH